MDLFRISWIKEKDAEESMLQFGVGVSSRNFRRAVDRNRIKRLIREAWRVQKNELKDLAANKSLAVFVFFTYTGKELPSFVEVNSAMTKAIEKLTGLISK